MSRTSKIIISITISALLAAYLFCVAKESSLPGIKSGQYQAVFLDNGQVYFGKLADESRFFARLSDVYYLKFSDGLQQGGDISSGKNLNLIRLGGEAHGPEREMILSKKTIVFYENLKKDSAVMQAISGNRP